MIVPKITIPGSDLEVSIVALGTGNFGRNDGIGNSLGASVAAEILAEALENGINFIDTSDSYGYGDSERMIGASLPGQRSKVILGTKFGLPAGPNPTERGGSSRWVRQAIEGSLERLQTDYIDLYQYHFPDPEVSFEETLGAMQQLVMEGIVRYLGVSNLNAKQMVQAGAAAEKLGITNLITLQSRYNLYERRVERNVVPICIEQGISLLAYSALARGLLTGKYRREHPLPLGSRFGVSEKLANEMLTERAFHVLDALERFASQRDLSLLSVAIGGLAAQPQVASVITSATSVEQLRATAHAASWRPTESDLDELNRITTV